MASNSRSYFCCSTWTGQALCLSLQLVSTALTRLILLQQLVVKLKPLLQLLLEWNVPLGFPPQFSRDLSSLALRADAPRIMQELILHQAHRYWYFGSTYSHLRLRLPLHLLSLWMLACCYFEPSWWGVGGKGRIEQVFEERLNNVVLLLSSSPKPKEQVSMYNVSQSFTLLSKSIWIISD